jgi:cysteine desulfurase
MTHRVLYFDHNATSPLDPAAREAWLEVMDGAWHNPSGLYPQATVARERLEDARERLADLLHADPARIVFTGGATAAANLVARWLGRQAAADARVITSGFEHPCVEDSLATAFRSRVAALPVDCGGQVSAEAVVAAVADGEAERAVPAVGVVAVMAASNESGVLQPWQEIAGVCREQGLPFLCDASQWLGKCPAAGLGACEWLIGSGHKFGGPRGVGFLLLPSGAVFRGDLGGPQEAGRHAGTEDVASVVAMVAALEAREARLAAGTAAFAAARDAAEARLIEQVPEAVIVGRDAQRLWNTLAVVIPGGDGKRLVAALGRAGIAASTGSACSAGAASAPHVLAAIGAARLGLEPSDLRGMVRLSGGPDTPAEAWLEVVDALAASVRDGAGGPPRVSLTSPPSRLPPAPGRQL